MAKSADAQPQQDGVALLPAPKESKPAEVELVAIDWQPTKPQTKKFRVSRSITNLVVSSLYRDLSKGLPVTVASRNAGISTFTYYAAIKQDARFAILMGHAQDKSLSKAHERVSKSLDDGDLETAKWYITRRDDRFKQHQYYSGIKNQQNNYNFTIHDGRSNGSVDTDTENK